MLLAVLLRTCILAANSIRDIQSLDDKTISIFKNKSGVQSLVKSTCTCILASMGIGRVSNVSALLPTWICIASLFISDDMVFANGTNSVPVGIHTLNNATI